MARCRPNTEEIDMVPSRKLANLDSSDSVEHVSPVKEVALNKALMAAEPLVSGERV